MANNTIFMNITFALKYESFSDAKAQEIKTPISPQTFI